MSLDFVKGNDRHRKGLNYTVRRGIKWAGRVKVGDIIGCGKSREAVIVDVIVCNMAEMLEKVYDFHHLGMKNFSMMADGMTKCYGSQNWEDEVVTCLGYVFLK